MRAWWSLTTTELRRFRGPLPLLSAIFLICVPLLYGATYLWSNWDPYGRLDQLKVAVVNLDQPVQAEGTKVHGGKDIVEQLLATLSDLPRALIDVVVRFEPDCLRITMGGPPAESTPTAPTRARWRLAATIGAPTR